MSPTRRKPKPAGARRNGQKPKPVDLWRPVPQLPEPTPISPPGDPTALLRSLGAPPLPGQGAAAERYLAVVVERAAALAVALAATAGVLAEPDPDSDQDGNTTPQLTMPVTVPNPACPGLPS